MHLQHELYMREAAGKPLTNTMAAHCDLRKVWWVGSCSHEGKHLRRPPEVHTLQQPIHFLKLCF